MANLKRVYITSLVVIVIKLFYNYTNLLFHLCSEMSAKWNRPKKYNSEDENHPYQEDLTEIDNPFKKRTVKLIRFSVILYLQENKTILIILIIQ